MAAKVKALQEWCRRQCDGYRDVNITNLTSSWKSGLAFCAIIHRYRPDLIDYDSLSKEDVYDNNKLAFDVAREKLGIPALLDPEDMVVMTVPDKLCIVTYVAQYYNYFHNKPQDGGPGVRVGVKRQSFHEQFPVSGSKDSNPPDAKKPAQHAVVDEPMQIASQDKDSVSRRTGTLEDRCHICHNKVYLLERHMTAGRLFHRHCYRGHQRASSIYKKVPDEKENVTPDEMGDAGSNGRNGQTKKNGFSDVSRKPDSEQSYDTGTQASKTKGGLSAAYSPVVSRQPDKTKAETVNVVVTKPTVGNITVSEVKNFTQPITTQSSSGLLRTLYNVPSYTTSAVSGGFSLNANSDADQGFVKNATTRPVEQLSPRIATSKSNGTVKVSMYSNATSTVPITTVTSLSNTSAFVSGSNLRFAPATSTTSSSSAGLIMSVAVAKPGSGRPFNTVGNVSTSSGSNSTVNIASNSPISVPKYTSSGVAFKTISVSANPSLPQATSTIASVSTTFSNFSSNSSSDKQKYTLSPVGVTLKSSTQKYSTPPVVASAAANFIKSPITPLSDAKNTVNASSLKPLNTSIVTTNPPSLAGRAEITSVTWSSPWSTSRPHSSMEKSAVPSDNAQLSAGIKTSDHKNSPSENPRNYTGSPSAEVKSSSRDSRTKERDRDIVTGLLQKLAEVRNDKQLTPTAAVIVNSSSSYSPKILSGINTSRSEIVSTPISILQTSQTQRVAVVTSSAKSILQTSQTQPVAVVTSSAKSFVSSYTQVTCTSVTKTVGSIVASANSKTEWQLEAERRAAARSGGYIDPEKHPRRATDTSQQSQMPTAGLQTVVNPIVSVTKQSIEHDTSKTNDTKPSKPCEPHVKDVVLTVRHDRIVSDKALLPVTSPMGDQATYLVISSVAPDTSENTMIFVRPQIVLPSQPSQTSVVPHKITDSSEPALPFDEILNRLEELDKQLQVMELEGRELEKKIRSGSDDAMDEDKDSIMGMWFDLIKQRNELVREESYLMYKRRQQELEQLHEELEYQLRCLLEKPEELKSPEDKRHEEELLSELVETVSLRSAIVDSIEVDRLRYLEEDQKLEAMMANSSLSENKSSDKKKNTKLKKKSQTFTEKQEEKVKTKKKLFAFTSMKKSRPKKDTDSSSSSWYAADIV